MINNFENKRFHVHKQYSGKRGIFKIVFGSDSYKAAFEFLPKRLDRIPSGTVLEYCYDIYDSVEQEYVYRLSFYNIVTTKDIKNYNVIEHLGDETHLLSA